MANEQIISIKKFLGLNENPDGDTVLKRGELAEMRNFRITQDGHLQIRLVVEAEDVSGSIGFRSV